MAILAMYSASTALDALETALDVSAHNLANINTTGFKSSRTNFADLLYLERAQPGTENTNGDQRPIGIYVGLGTKVTGTQLNFEQGPAEQTGRQLDVAIDGNGFFQVQVEDELGEGLAYTRAGHFTLNSDGEIVMASDEGRRLEPNLVVPEDAVDISIAADGTVSVSLFGVIDPQEIGTLELATFINPAGLKQIGDSLYVPSAASGDALVGEPREGGRGSLLQSFLEGSNVDPVTELVDLIRTQRAFELNSQSIQIADEVLQTVSQLRRF